MLLLAAGSFWLRDIGYAAQEDAWVIGELAHEHYQNDPQGESTGEFAGQILVAHKPLHAGISVMRMLAGVQGFVMAGLGIVMISRSILLWRR